MEREEKEAEEEEEEKEEKVTLMVTIEVPALYQKRPKASSQED